MPGTRGHPEKFGGPGHRCWGHLPALQGHQGWLELPTPPSALAHPSISPMSVWALGKGLCPRRHLLPRPPVWEGPKVTPSSSLRPPSLLHLLQTHPREASPGPGVVVVLEWIFKTNLAGLQIIFIYLFQREYTQITLTLASKMQCLETCHQQFSPRENWEIYTP